eukprot:scaffold48602_cov20-Tisochrysis_lutea.AAC.5
MELHGGAVCTRQKEERGACANNGCSVTQRSQHSLVWQANGRTFFSADACSHAPSSVCSTCAHAHRLAHSQHTATVIPFLSNNCLHWQWNGKAGFQLCRACALTPTSQNPASCACPSNLIGLCLRTCICLHNPVQHILANAHHMGKQHSPEGAVAARIACSLTPSPTPACRGSGCLMNPFLHSLINTHLQGQRLGGGAEGAAGGLELRCGVWEGCVCTQS